MAYGGRYSVAPNQKLFSDCVAAARKIPPGFVSCPGERVRAMQVRGSAVCRPICVRAKPVEETGACTISVDVQISIHQEDAVLFGIDLSDLVFSTTTTEQAVEGGPERTVHLAARIVPSKRLSLEPHRVSIGDYEFRGTPRIVAIKPEENDNAATVEMRIECLAVGETNADLLHEIHHRLGGLQSMTLEPCQLSLIDGGREIA